MTFIKTTDSHRRQIYLNADMISNVNVQNESFVNVNMVNGDWYDITPDEWARIEAILAPELHSDFDKTLKDLLAKWYDAPLYRESGSAYDAIKTFVYTVAGKVEAPALPVDKTPSYHALHEAYKKAQAAWNWQDVGLFLYPHVAYFLTGQTPKMPSKSEDAYNRAPTLPDDVIESWNAFDEISMKFETMDPSHPDYKATENSFNHLQAMFLTNFGDFIGGK